ncbi:hypothetical protein L226DRAFT_484721 [Lentinus tigrinus ALCF2SS1-7]|uniref:Uncharacterized protein n=1 Tax=Lentinus tigrinus ALCF2SS1-6 TaxID=1328759 RepID=A0A5C2S9P6_9APHY|nr:hypothetical protein L227DRAFT_525707 [Lentinus tigrinus ALCF2SS1-6]RPD75793.1 hypothetical protein L226DRAFT_484721 [Lentinus tigrinus ALCF2SS1-7]
MAADDKTLKIAARLVCTDQWLVTHVDPSWSILQLKQYLLHKFLQDPADEDHNPRAIPVSPRKTRRRSLSPITFAAPPPRKAKLPPGPPTSDEDSSMSDVSADVDDDDVNITKSFTDAHRYKYNARPSTSSASESVTRLLSDGGPDPQAYILLTFSTTQILEDRFSLSWYDIHPHELLELHPVSVSFISLQRCSLDAYIAPYFAARVWALRIVGNKFDAAPSILRKRNADDDGTAEGRTSGARDKKRKVAVEWKERWAIIHQGVLSLCKERHDTHAAFSAPLSALLSIRDSAHFTLPLHARRLRQKSSSPPASNVVCLKFASPSSERQRTFSNESMSVSFERRTSDPHASSFAPSGSGSQGAWWRRGSRDVSTTLTMGLASSASILVGSGNVMDAWDSFARRGSRTGLDDSDEEGTPAKEKGKGKARDDDEDSVWIVLDMLNSGACSHILRVLHRQAPSACHSTFLPSRTPSMCSPAPSPIIFSSRASTPVTPMSPTTPGPSASYNFPQPPMLSPTSASPMPLPLATPSSTSLNAYPFPVVNESRRASPAVKLPTIDTSVTAHNLGLPYPAWRLSLVRNARRAGLGAVGRAMELVMFGDEDEEDLADIEDAEDDDLAIEWARRNSSVGPSPIEPPPIALSPTTRSREQFKFPTRHDSASDPAFKSIPEEGPAPHPDLDTPSQLEPAPVLEPPPRPHRTSHPLVDLRSLYSTERDTLHDSDGSEAEWDGWVDALVAQRREDALLARARGRRDALLSPEGVDTVLSGTVSTVRPAGSGGPFWAEGWSSQFGGSRTSLSQMESPDVEHPDEEGGTWDWVQRSDVEIDVDTESSAHSSDPNAGSIPGSQRRASDSRVKRQHKNTAQLDGEGQQTLSSYSSADSLLKRTIRTNIKSIKNLSLGQAKRASMHVLFPSASKSDVNLDPDVPPRAASASPPPSQNLSPSRPSMTSMRSTTSVSTSTRPRPFSPLSSQLPEQGHDDDEDDEEEPEDGDGDEEHEADADVDDVDEGAEGEGEGYMDSELGHNPQLTGGHHPIPMPGMRMVPAGYTTFQHSALYGRGAAEQGAEEKTHAGIVHGQSMQKLPMGMGRMVTTVSSTVSVGPSARRGATR